MDKTRVIFHLDMDAFFAAVEQRDNPALKGKPVVIGADPKGGKGRGVVSTCSYEARPYGVHSAQPISLAYKKCPHAVFLPVNFSKYHEASDKVFSILNEFTDAIEPISIDEAFLDMTESYHFYGSPFAAAQRIKERIYSEISLNASIGIAPVKFVAKIASDSSKPNGLLEIKSEKVLEFLHPLPISRLWGVGKKTQAMLNQLGMMTIGDVAGYDQRQLLDLFGEHGMHLYALSQGIDPRGVENDREAKSVSHENTFEVDETDPEKIRQMLLQLSELVSRRLRKHQMQGRTVSLKIRTSGFQTFTRTHTFENRVNLIDDIYGCTKELFNTFFKKGMRIRLVGVRLSNFDSEYIQENLFIDPVNAKREKVHQALDRIKDKFGEQAIHRGI